MKKVVVVSTSLHQGSNSEHLADQFIRGAQDAGHQVMKIDLKQKDIQYCIGCLTCQKRGSCFIQDDMNFINEQLKVADVIVYATPVYFYEMAGQMKTLLDRTNPLFDTDYCFRDVYVLASAAEAEPSAFDKLLKGVQGWVDCFDGVVIRDILRAGGVTNSNEVLEHHDMLKQAYSMGANIE